MTFSQIGGDRPRRAGVPRGPARLLVLRLVVEVALAILAVAAILPLAALRGSRRLRVAFWSARRAAIRVMGRSTHAASAWSRDHAAGIRREPIHELKLP